MSNLIKMIDIYLCKYLSIKSEEITPTTLKKTGKNITISNTDSFKRHIHTHKIESFLNENINKLNSINKKKLGLAVGEILATNLVVSFDHLNIRES
tara:strand:- start:3880 stop:4167 length:288 start_codon:yes stop_codon:yes gene_type:complete